MADAPADLPCPICEATPTERCWERAWTGRAEVGGGGFRPNADTFGVTIGPVRRCPDCGHRFVQLPEQFADGVAYEGVEGDDDPAAREGALLTYADRCRRLREAGVGPRLLEVGCWDAAHFDVYRRHGFEPTGIEPSAWAVARAAAAGQDVRAGTMDDAAVVAALDPPYDAVLLFDVVEHVTDPRALMASAVDLVRPGGHVVMTTPRSSALVARGMGPRWWSVMPMHVQFFSDASARRLVEREARCGEARFALEPKAFPLSYYAGRLQKLLHLPRPLVRPGRGLGRRAVAPNFRDRLWIDAAVTGAV